MIKSYVKHTYCVWVLKYLSTGKGTTPYEVITRYDSLEHCTRKW